MDTKGKRQSKNVDDQTKGQSRTSVAKSYLDQQTSGIERDLSRMTGSNETLAQISKRVTSTSIHSQLRKGF